MTHLRPIMRNKTRWSSSYEMAAWYPIIRYFLPKISIQEVEELCLSASENRGLDLIIADLNEMEGVTKTFQRERKSMSDVRALLNAFINCFWYKDSRISTSATIISNALFESAVVTVQLRSSSYSSLEERAALLRFETSKNAFLGNGDASIFFVDRKLTLQLPMFLTVHERYMDLCI